jgi:FMN phosphatase YigB (HAD superfamily)
VTKALALGQFPTRTPRAILFDIGRVIIPLNLKRALEPFAAMFAARKSQDSGPPAKQGIRWSPEETWRQIQSDPRWPDWQEGRMSPQEWHKHLTGRFKIPLAFADFCETWNRVLDPETLLSDNFFSELSKLFRLGLVSNTDPLHVEAIEERFGFLRYFSVKAYSCAVGASKPSSAIYAAALRALDVPAKQALYIDDIPAYVETAREMNMDGIVFTTPKQLENELAVRGVLAFPNPTGSAGNLG